MHHTIRRLMQRLPADAEGIRSARTSDRTKSKWVDPSPPHDSFTHVRKRLHRSNKLLKEKACPWYDTNCYRRAIKTKNGPTMQLCYHNSAATLAGAQKEEKLKNEEQKKAHLGVDGSPLKLGSDGGVKAGGYTGAETLLAGEPELQHGLGRRVHRHNLLRVLEQLGARHLSSRPSQSKQGGQHRTLRRL